MNWGYKILVVIVVFILSMFAMVFVAFKQDNEMMDKNYYEKEMRYQSLINAAANLKGVNNDSLIVQTSSTLEIHIPKIASTGFNNGKIEFLRNDDSKKDVNLSFNPDAKGVFLLEKSKFSKGFYKARIEWKDGDKSFYKEMDINIQ